MRKLLVILTVMAIVNFATVTAYADWAIDNRINLDEYDASAVIGGDPGVLVDFECSLKHLYDDPVGTAYSADDDAAAIAWTGVEGGTTRWLRANQYIEARGFATYETWGIQVYTDNTQAAVNPYSGTGNPAGLVRSDNTIFSIPMCWRTKVGYNDNGTPDEPGSLAISALELQILQGTIPDPLIPGDTMTVLYDGVPGHEPGGAKPYYPWFFALDKQTDSDPETDGVQTYFTNGYYYDATFLGSSGYHHAPGNVTANFATPSDAEDVYYIYMGASFTLAMPGKTYTTSTLTVESFHL